MPTFTFFLEYKGGTYISQVEAGDFREAPFVWIEQLDLSKIPNRPRAFKHKVLKSLKEFEMITPITGIKNTWCCSLLYLDGETLHFTETAVKTNLFESLILS